MSMPNKTVVIVSTNPNIDQSKVARGHKYLGMLSSILADKAPKKENKQ